MSLKLLGLAEQPKLKARVRPSRPTATLKLPWNPYVTHLTLLQQEETATSLLIAASSDGALRAHDALTLASLAQATWTQSTVGDISAITPAKHVHTTALVAGKKGVVALWDPRRNHSQAALSMQGPSRAAYLSLASTAYSIAVGTELKGDEAMIDLWDIRAPLQPRLTYTESHSDDITSLAFHHGPHSHLLLSGSTDGLLCVLDTRQADEDEAVLGVSNTGASVARAGWGATGSTATTSRRTSIPAAGLDLMNVDGHQDEYELNVKEERAKGMGGFWAVSDMQTLTTWNEDFDAVLPSTDARDVRCFEWQTDYVIDAYDAPSLAFGDDLQQEGLSMFVGTQSGRVALLQVDAESQQASAWRLVSMLPDSMAGTGGHCDIVRAVAWDAASRNLYTGGEDAQLSVWDMTASGVSSFGAAASADASLLTPLSATHAAESQDVGMESPGAARRGARLSSRHTPY